MNLMSYLERAKSLDRLTGPVQSVARGPATAPQPVFRTRVVGGIIQVCLPGAG
jgi:hypothetical protein